MGPVFRRNLSDVQKISHQMIEIISGEQQGEG